MAALTEFQLPEVCELRQVSAAELDRLLEEETAVWQQDLAWDFRPSAELVRRFVQMQSLNGFALRAENGLVGYAYQVCDERKGLIGDFYVKPSAQSPSNELSLLGAIVQSLMRTPGVRRIESQLMLIRTPLTQPLPFSSYLTRHDRHFMRAGASSIGALEEREAAYRIRIVPWMDRHQEEAAHVIAASYRGHVDSEINDQYRNIPGARRFLTNIVRYPGCGRFSSQASLVAIDEQSGRICGLCLASLVSSVSGHITQLCVLPGVRGSQIGYALLRESMKRLLEQSCQSVSLTVTCSNVGAIGLYERMGFRTLATFPALVWEDF